jgi:hypothetical protein
MLYYPTFSHIIQHLLFNNNLNIYQSNANPPVRRSFSVGGKGKSLFAEGEMSFGVANCSGLLQKGQKCLMNI